MKKVVAFLFRAFSIACAVGFVGSIGTIERGGEGIIYLINAVIYFAVAFICAIIAEVLDGDEEK